MLTTKKLIEKIQYTFHCMNTKHWQRTREFISKPVNLEAILKKRKNRKHCGNFMISQLENSRKSKPACVTSHLGSWGRWSSGSGKGGPHTPFNILSQSPWPGGRRGGEASEERQEAEGEKGVWDNSGDCRYCVAQAVLPGYWFVSKYDKVKKEERRWRRSS